MNPTDSFDDRDPGAPDAPVVIYEAPPIFITATRIGEWLDVTYSAAAKMVYRGDFGPWAKIGSKLIVRTETLIESIKAHEKAGWRTWYKPHRTYPRPDPRIIEMLRRPPRQPGSKKQREAEAVEPVKERLRKWRESGKLKPDPLLVSLLNKEITPKQYKRLKADRKLGNRIHAGIAKAEAARLAGKVDQEADRTNPGEQH